MFLTFHNRKGQSTMEYAVVIGVIVAALLAMQMYMKRGIQGRLRSSADSIGSQYSAGYTTGNFTTTHTPEVTTDTFGVLGKGISQYRVVTPSTVSREGTEAIDQPFKCESLYWIPANNAVAP